MPNHLVTLDTVTVQILRHTKYLDIHKFLGPIKRRGKVKVYKYIVQYNNNISTKLYRNPIRAQQ